MNWSTTPPTKPGFYLWRINAQDKRISMREIFTPCNDVLIDRGSDLQPKDVRGQWLRLVPAEEVEKAWEEGLVTGRKEALAYEPFTKEELWLRSDAKQIAEGTL